MNKFKLFIISLLLAFGFINFSNSFDLPGFTKIYDNHLTSCTTTILNVDNPTNVCHGSTVYMYSSTDLGMYCVSLENISLSNFSSTTTTNMLSIGLGIVANNSTANNSYLRLSQSTLSQYSAGTNSNDVILCGSNFIQGKSADFLITFTSALSNLFANNGLTFDLRMYYMPFNFDSSSLCSSYISELSTCQSSLSSLSGSLSICNSDYNSCLTDYGSCSSSLNYCYYDLGNCRAGVCSGEYLSNLYINNEKYTSQSNIFVNIPDYLTFDYSSEGNIADINVDYNVDEDYLIDIINKEKLTPTNGDFEALINGLQYYIPYIMVALLLGRTVYVLKKVFRF